MTSARRQVWRAAPSTLIFVSIFALVVLICIPGLAYLLYVRERELVIPILLGVLTVLMLVYAWRFGLHPKVRSSAEGLQVSNPIRSFRFDWEEITVVTPGENGLLIGSEETLAEAWCIQKSNHATKKGLNTRADRIANEIIDLLDEQDPPATDEETKLAIRRARPGDQTVVTTIARTTSSDPANPIEQRTRALLRDHQLQTRILEAAGTPVGFVSYGEQSVAQLAVLPDHRRRGYGSALLEYACQQQFEEGHHGLKLWVAAEDEIAQAFFKYHGWVTADGSRNSEFSPFGEEIRLTKRNPAAPRRSRG